MHLTGIEYFIIANPILTYAIIFFGMMIEGEGIILIASIFAWQGHLSWLILTGVVLAGTYLGDLVWYGLGRGLRGTRFGAWLDKKYEAQGDWIRNNIVDRYSHFAVVAKFMYFTTHPTVFVVGWHRFSFRRFLLVTAYAAVVWAGVVLCAGYFFGYAIHLIGFKKIVHRIEFVAIAVFAGIYLCERLFRKVMAKWLKRGGTAQ